MIKKEGKKRKEKKEKKVIKFDKKNNERFWHILVQSKDLTTL